jgi:effector-binding domain-containing protein
MTVTAERTLNQTTTPETVQWPETHYVFIEKVGPIPANAPQAWNAMHPLVPAIAENNQVTGYMSLYDMGQQIYRAGVSVVAEPRDLPKGVRYEKFAGGKYAKFVLTGPYMLLPQATGRACELVREQKLRVRAGFNIENYVDDPRVTPEDQLRTEILFPVE